MIKMKIMRWYILLALFVGLSGFFYFGYKVRDVGFKAYLWVTGKHIITDWGCVTTTQVDAIVKPKTVEEVGAILARAREAGKKVSIAGARYSQGGQIAYPDGIVIDMRSLNAITHLDTRNKKVTVQAGAIWRELQEYIDPYNLSVKEMQSYNDFSIGGALSVNAHGRDAQQGQLIETVDSITVMLADGSLVQASRDNNVDLFRAAIGGYGAMGIIIDATLSLVDNYKITVDIQKMPIDEYADFYFKHIHTDKSVVLHNANVYPPKLQEVMSVAWRKTNKSLTQKNRLQQEKQLYVVDRFTLHALRLVPGLKQLRQGLDTKVLGRGDVVMRNFETSYRTKSLEPLLCVPTTYVLNEYFIPVEKLNDFMDALRTIISKYHVKLLNCSIRHVEKNTESILTYAPQDMFAFVLYINMLNTPSGQEYSGLWARELIDTAINLGGTYYLPYQLHATQDQIKRAYPQLDEFVVLKKKYDPDGIFSNNLLQKYLH